MMEHALLPKDKTVSASAFLIAGSWSAASLVWTAVDTIMTNLTTVGCCAVLATVVRSHGMGFVYTVYRLTVFVSGGQMTGCYSLKLLDRCRCSTLLRVNVFLFGA